jgi:hypothetical protein
VTDLIAEIAAASNEQSTGIDQVNRAVAQMDQVVQSNAAQTEELSSTARALAAEAGSLQELVGRFKLEAGEGASVRTPAPGPKVAPRAASRVPALPVVKLPAPPKASDSEAAFAGVGTNGSNGHARRAHPAAGEGYEEF